MAYSQYKKVGASVISKGSGNWYNTYVINKGSKDGIKVNMNVIADGGLVGIVTETGRTYAKVCSIINDSSSVSAKSSQAGDTCVVQGNSESVQKDGTIDVTYISKDADMKEGEELVTSHISSKYLEGIKIGTVSKISTDSSNLTKAAIAGHDANWGRILCAMGYSGAQFDPEKVDVFFESKAGKIQIIENGTAVDYSEEKATEILSQEEVKAVADVKMGSESATAWGCDLTHGYIDINADYRS